MPRHGSISWLVKSRLKSVSFDKAAASSSEVLFDDAWSVRHRSGGSYDDGCVLRVGVGAA